MATSLNNSPHRGKDWNHWEFGMEAKDLEPTLELVRELFPLDLRKTVDAEMQSTS